MSLSTLPAANGFHPPGRRHWRVVVRLICQPRRPSLSSEAGQLPSGPACHIGCGQASRPMPAHPPCVTSTAARHRPVRRWSCRAATLAAISMGSTPGTSGAPAASRALSSGNFATRGPVRPCPGRSGVPQLDAVPGAREVDQGLGVGQRAQIMETMIFGAGAARAAWRTPVSSRRRRVGPAPVLQIDAVRPWRHSSNRVTRRRGRPSRSTNGTRGQSFHSRSSE